MGAVVDRMGCSFQCGLQSGQTWVVVLDRKWFISGMRSCLRIAHGITLADKDTLILPQQPPSQTFSCLILVILQSFFSSISLTFVTGDRTWSTATGMARIRLQFSNKPSRTSAAPSRSRDGQRWPGCCRPSSRSDSTQRESFQYGLKVLSTQTVFEKV